MVPLMNKFPVSYVLNSKKQYIYIYICFCNYYIYLFERAAFCAFDICDG